MKASSGSRRWRGVGGARGTRSAWHWSSHWWRSRHVTFVPPSPASHSACCHSVPELHYPSLCPLWLPQSEYTICSLSEPRLKGHPGDLGTAILVFLGSMDKFLPHTDHHEGVGTRCHLWPLSLTVLVPTPPLFSLSHPSSDTVTSSEFRLLKVTLLDLTEPPFLVPELPVEPPFPQSLCCVYLSSSSFDKIFAPANRLIISMLIHCSSGGMAQQVGVLATSLVAWVGVRSS